MLASIADDNVITLLKKYCDDMDHEPLRKQLAQQYDGCSQEEVLNQFSRPCFSREITFDHQIKMTQTVNEERLSTYQRRSSSFIEGQHLFATAAARDRAIEGYEAKCEFNSPRVL